MIEFWALLVALGIPSGITGIGFWAVKRELTKRAAAAEAIEKRRHDMEQIILECQSACMQLSVATAKAVQRIPDAKCNGDMAEALEKAKKVSEAKNKFFADLAVTKLS